MLNRFVHYFLPVSFSSGEIPNMQTTHPKVAAFRVGYEKFRGIADSETHLDRGFFLVDYEANSSNISFGTLAQWDSFHKNGEVIHFFPSACLGILALTSALCCH